MKLKLAAATCVCILVLCGIKAKAQAFRQLTPDDFLGVPHTSGGVIAYTNCTIDFKYQAYRRNGYYKLNSNVTLTINHYRSWMDKQHITSVKQMAEILKHEQGHYNIAYLEQQELIYTINQTVFGADYQTQAMSLFNRIDAKYRQLNLDYDEDTAHMINRTHQNSWDNWFRRQLGTIPIGEELSDAR